MGYLLLESAPVRRAGGYALRSVRQTDAELIRLMRNESLPVLRQTAPLSYAEQQRYFSCEIMAEQQLVAPRQMLFMLTRDDLSGGSVGYGGLTHIDWRVLRAELSFLGRPREDYARDFRAFLRLLHEVAFDDLGLNRIYHETYARSPVHRDVLNEFGYLIEGRLRSHVLVDEKLRDSYLYGLLATDWTSS